jgi:hypothetical protein
VTLADNVVAKRDGRAKFSVRPDKQIASLVAQKNATARKEARAKRRGHADMSALYGAEKNRITREIQSLSVGSVVRMGQEVRCICLLNSLQTEELAYFPW